MQLLWISPRHLTVYYGLIIAKLQSYGVDFDSLRLTRSYLLNPHRVCGC